MSQNREVRKERRMGEIMSVRERILIREKTETPNEAKRKMKEGAWDTLLNLHNLNVNNGIINKFQAYF